MDLTLELPVGTNAVVIRVVRSGDDKAQAGALEYDSWLRVFAQAAEASGTAASGERTRKVMLSWR